MRSIWINEIFEGFYVKRGMKIWGCGFTKSFVSFPITETRLLFMLGRGLLIRSREHASCIAVFAIVANSINYNKIIASAHFPSFELEISGTLELNCYLFVGAWIAPGPAFGMFSIFTFKFNHYVMLVQEGGVKGKGQRVGV